MQESNPILPPRIEGDTRTSESSFQTSLGPFLERDKFRGDRRRLLKILVAAAGTAAFAPHVMITPASAEPSGPGMNSTPIKEAQSEVVNVPGIIQYDIEGQALAIPREWLAEYGNYLERIKISPLLERVVIVEPNDPRLSQFDETTMARDLRPPGMLIFENNSARPTILLANQPYTWEGFFSTGYHEAGHVLYNQTNKSPHKGKYDRSLRDRVAKECSNLTPYDLSHPLTLYTAQILTNRCIYLGDMMWSHMQREFTNLGFAPEFPSHISPTEVNRVLQSRIVKRDPESVWFQALRWWNARLSQDHRSSEFSEHHVFSQQALGRYLQMENSRYGQNVARLGSELAPVVQGICAETIIKLGDEFFADMHAVYAAAGQHIVAEFSPESHELIAETLQNLRSPPGT